ncbi:CLUMA_CG015649, isoform A [Clunio marinus]|uniref:CLUMA_CG015649, isoform A n=1 Tax=Clunio marinus TaxID=568069 RepID=A0A1J1IRB8_9DIPT|nr:CLUMA_CG015649, isoform A [Clunio marinus]
MIRDFIELPWLSKPCQRQWPIIRESCLRTWGWRYRHMLVGVTVFIVLAEHGGSHSLIGEAKHEHKVSFNGFPESPPLQIS